MFFNEAEFLFETNVPRGELIVSRTDLQGIITYVNDTFAQISGYKANELIGKHHNIVRHPDMPKVVFKEMWSILEKGKTWEGIIKNLRKNRGFYWVKAIVSGVYKDGEIVEYKSLRYPIGNEEKVSKQKEYDILKKENNEKKRYIEYR